jgi:hypothetical protein
MKISNLIFSAFIMLAFCSFQVEASCSIPALFKTTDYSPLDVENYFKKISKKDIICIFESSPNTKAIDVMRLLLNTNDIKFMSYWGKNSFPVFNRFMKHFFFKKNELYGFNTSLAGKTLNDPGIFKLQIVNNKFLFNYNLNFAETFLLSDMPYLFQSSFKDVKNNDKSLLFKNLFDDIKLIGGNVIVGKAYTNDVLKPKAYFILISKRE